MIIRWRSFRTHFAVNTSLQLSVLERSLLCRIGYQQASSTCEALEA